MTCLWARWHAFWRDRGNSCTADQPRSGPGPWRQEWDRGTSPPRSSCPWVARSGSALQGPWRTWRPAPPACEGPAWEGPPLRWTPPSPSWQSGGRSTCNRDVDNILPKKFKEGQRRSTCSTLPSLRWRALGSSRGSRDPRLWHSQRTTPSSVFSCLFIYLSFEIPSHG